MSDQFDEYYMGKIGAHSYWDEWSTLSEGFNNIMKAAQGGGLLPEGFGKQVGALAKKVPAKVPKMPGVVEKGIAAGGKYVPQLPTK